jgi:hypothetical protein
MINWIKNLFRSREKQLTKPVGIYSITCGERDEKGFCDTYVNGEKTNVRMLVFTEEQVKRLHKIQDDINHSK